jgi:NAD(P)-dependent dehydrogenase (short-subunit alcohol dehydrogenase family)
MLLDPALGDTIVVAPEVKPVMNTMGTASSDLAGKVAIITGASSGIGAAIALEMMRAGTRSVLVGRDEQRLAAIAARSKEFQASCTTVPIDLIEPDAPEQIVSEAVRVFGTLDVLVHSAGIYRRRPFLSTSMADFDEQWRVNIRAPFALSQAAIPYLREGGSIIFVSSMVALVGLKDSAAYASTKGALELLMRSLAVELGPIGIRVNSIAPGPIKTPMNEGFREDPDFEPALADRVPLKRWAMPEEVAPAAVFLASSAASFMHGATICIDGGWTAQ